MWDLIVSVPDHCISFYFGYIWITHEVGNGNAFLSQFKQCVIDICLQKWHLDINNSNKS